MLCLFDSANWMYGVSRISRVVRPVPSQGQTVGVLRTGQSNLFHPSRVLFLKTPLNCRKSFLLSVFNPSCLSVNPFPLRGGEDKVSHYQLWTKTSHILKCFVLLCHHFFLNNLSSLNLNPWIYSKYSTYHLYTSLQNLLVS